MTISNKLGRAFFSLLKQKKHLMCMSDISHKEVRAPLERLGSEMAAHALTMYGRRQREVNEHASTDDLRVCVAGDGKSGHSEV